LLSVELFYLGVVGGHDLSNKVVELTESVGECVGEVDFIVRPLERVLEGEHVILSAASHSNLGLTVSVTGGVALVALA
jgi:hypothetical protein